MIDAFTLIKPEGSPSAVVFSSPHSGAFYPSRFLAESILDAHTLRSSEDAYVNELFETAPRKGAVLISALYPRAYVDLNRAATELDPAVVQIKPIPGVNPRIAAGLGVIPRVVAEGRAIRSGKMSFKEAQHRLNTAYHPYHNALQNLLSQARVRHGFALLVDCHSMPHDAVRTLSPRLDGRPQIVLGDRFGASCSSDITDAIRAAFMRQGFRVALNAPFAGGHITQTYGVPARGVHAIQIEIDRSLYMEEGKIIRRYSFEQMQARISAVIEDIVQQRPLRSALAAE